MMRFLVLSGFISFRLVHGYILSFKVSTSHNFNFLITYSLECKNDKEYFQGSDLWKDRDRFKNFAKSSLELCKVYIEISLSTGSRDELLSAERHLRNIIKQVR